MKMQKEN